MSERACGQPAAWLVASERGHEPLCDECIRFRHRGDDFSLLRPAGGACVCTHMPGRLDRDRAWAGRRVPPWHAGLDH